MIPRLLLPVICLCILFSCAEEKPKGVLSKDEMAAMLVDFYLREARIKTNTVPDDSGAVIFSHLRRIFAQKNGINDSIIDRSFNYYIARPHELQDVYTRVIDTLALKEQRTYSSTYK
ncbi:MAG: DUF4296 domain-containing protein [Cyclobacteriaceae bacterium]